GLVVYLGDGQAQPSAQVAPWLADAQAPPVGVHAVLFDGPADGTLLDLVRKSGGSHWRSELPEGVLAEALLTALVRAPLPAPVVQVRGGQVSAQSIAAA